MMKIPKQKIVVIILIVSLILSLTVYIFEVVTDSFEPIVTRNGYGEGKKIEEYELTIKDQKETIQIEVEEQEYSHEEIQEVFAKIISKLDQIVLG